MTLPSPANDNWPLFLERTQAANFCGLSKPTFDSWVRKGILPRSVAGTRRWSRLAIERAAGGATTQIATEHSPFEEWKQSNAR